MTTLTDYLGLIISQVSDPAPGDMIARGPSGGWTTVPIGDAGENDLLILGPDGLPIWSSVPTIPSTAGVADGAFLQYQGEGVGWADPLPSLTNVEGGYVLTNVGGIPEWAVIPTQTGGGGETGIVEWQEVTEFNGGWEPAYDHVYCRITDANTFQVFGSITNPSASPQMTNVLALPIDTGGQTSPGYTHINFPAMTSLETPILGYWDGYAQLTLYSLSSLPANTTVAIGGVFPLIPTSSFPS